MFTWVSGWVGGWVGGWWVGDITCIFFVPMSTIDDYGQCSFLLQSLGALTSRTLGYHRQGALCGDLIGCAHSLAVGDIRVFCL